MTVSNKTRKVLWGRSGNLCALCRRGLVIDPTEADDESVIGEECHIVSPRPGGARNDPDFPSETLHAASNLILLCRVHHKMVDDQSETYTVEMLNKLKANHEQWVASSLAASDARIDPVRLEPVPGGSPRALPRLTTGKEVTELVGRALGYAFDHDNVDSKVDANLIANFLQSAQDWGDIWSDIDAGGRVDGAFDLHQMLQDLGEAGYWVFGATEMRRMVGGIRGPEPFPIAHLEISRSDSPSIVNLADRDSPVQSPPE